ncbi:hypothetical protein, partial [Pseudomonas sp. EL_65y_Pfl1_R32]|uniref:hypothetical protein n=1 Tax=Pseudomonas sp. EL_65y_Pfl1_R32 TaxID=3088696 RepID=UPI0030DCDE72
LIAQGDCVNRPTGVILRAISHNSDAQRLAPFELGQGGQHAEFCFAPVDSLVAVDEIEQLVRCFF